MFFKRKKKEQEISNLGTKLLHQQRHYRMLCDCHLYSESAEGRRYKVDRIAALKRAIARKVSKNA
jgi:hypothetical protein